MKVYVKASEGLISEPEQPGSRDDLTVGTDKNQNKKKFRYQFWYLAKRMFLVE